ncbi:hypothetical protein CDD83_10547 [Cordyceps sp. RAO-2017]|nr:hypothetical protein CDD83_10547 [Cordyceps sp. RAO-2017]
MSRGRPNSVLTPILYCTAQHLPSVQRKSAPVPRQSGHRLVKRFQLPASLRACFAQWRQRRHRPLPVPVPTPDPWRSVLAQVGKACHVPLAAYHGQSNKEQEARRGKRVNYSTRPAAKGGTGFLPQPQRHPLFFQGSLRKGGRRDETR